MNRRSIPNAICIARIILVVPIVLALRAGNFGFALALIVAGGASDLLDGYLARRFGWRTRLGSLLDPAADKLLVVSVFVTLTLLGLVPLGLTVVIILRDLVIVTGALSYQRVSGSLQGEPLLISKLNTACQIGFIVLTLTHAIRGQPPAFWLTLLGATVVFTSITSGLSYILVWSRRAREHAAA